MKKENFLFIAGFGLSPTQRASIAKAARHQEEVMQVMAVLPGKYRYEQVEAAIKASGVAPRTIYEYLAANQCTYVLARFHEALH